MKKLFKRVVLIVVMVTALIANGTNVTVNINEKSKTINLKIDNNDGELKISIIDVKGIVLHSEMYQGTKFSKNFDFKTLPNGSYYFEVEGETKVKVIPVTVSSVVVKLIEDTNEVYFKPIIRRVEDKIFISKLNLAKDVLAITFYDEEGYLLYNEEIKDDLNLSKILNIKHLTKGEYSLVLKSSGKTFIEKIVK